jgi:hypothetical protein
VEDIKNAISTKKNKILTTDLENEFLKRGGDGMAQCVYDVIQAVWKDEFIPQQWNESIITSVWKGKGDKEVLKNQRGISVSSSIGMTMEEILNGKILQVIDFTQAQGGGMKNYSTADHLFLIRGIMTYSICMHANWTLTFYDIQKAYDKAERKDMIHMLWEKSLRGKNLMNKDLTSKIRTPYGLTCLVKREVGRKQGGK